MGVNKRAMKEFTTHAIRTDAGFNDPIH